MTLAKPLFHDSIYDATVPAPSYWEATAPGPGENDRPVSGSEKCDVAIIGGGYTGLSAALHLVRDHHIDVRVLEAGHIGWGASGRNGGICTLPATKLSVGQMIRRHGLVETKRFFRSQVDAVQVVEDLARDESIDFDRQGEGSYEVAHRPSRFAELQEMAHTYRELFGIPTEIYDADAFVDVGHRSTEQFGAVHVGVGFGLHPLKFLLGLAAAARRRGANLHPYSYVVRWERHEADHILHTNGGRVVARRVIVAANGFLRDELHPRLAGRFVPIISNILVTRPLSPSELDAQGWLTETPLVNTRELLFYYRLLPDKSLLFGARGDLTGAPDSSAAMRAWLIRRMGEVFPAWRDVEPAYFWRGLVCMTPRLTPVVGAMPDDPSVWAAYGYHGTGVSGGPWAGRAVARIVAGAESPEAVLPSAMFGLPRRVPGGSFRRWLTAAAYAYYRWADARD